MSHYARKHVGMMLRLSVVAPIVLCGAFAAAQLSTSVGGSLSQPLDSSIYGGNTAAAPTSSTSLEPGANNLLAPEDRVLPYDSIGASIVATRMTPSVTQFYPLLLNRTPYQIDNSLKDATYVTGLRQVIPANIIDIIARKPGKLASPFQVSSFGPAPGSSTVPLPESALPGVNSNLAGEASQQSFWRVGGSTAALTANSFPSMAALTANSLPFSQESQQQSGQPLNSTKTADLKGLGRTNGVILSRKGLTQGKQAGATSGSTVQPPDSSRSPLEAPDGDQSSIAVEVASPFESLDQSSFLNPDITLATPPRHLSRRAEEMLSRAGTLSESRIGSELSTREWSEFQPTSQLAINRRLSGRSRMMKNRELSPDQMRLMKLSSGNNAVRKPKWHNPILEQMETGANPNRQ